MKSVAAAAVDTRSRVAVLISGAGSNLQALIDACASGALSAQVVVVVSSRTDAGGLSRARLAGIPTVALPHVGFADRDAHERALVAALEPCRPDLIVLAGWMRVLGPTFLTRFGSRTINLHPALSGAFPGPNAIARAWAAFQRGEIDRTGVMVHRVVAEVDAGPVVAVCEVALHSGESLPDLTARVRAEEHRLLVDAVGLTLTGDVPDC